MCRSAHQSLANYTCTHTTHTDTHKHTRTHAHTTRRWVNKFRKEAKLMTGASTSGEIWQYFLNKARDNLHIVLAMSPSGDSLRIRCRNFPGMVSQCVIDWFYTWPEDAISASAALAFSTVMISDCLVAASCFSAASIC